MSQGQKTAKHAAFDKGRKTAPFPDHDVKSPKPEGCNAPGACYRGF